jgi:uncharacterized protein (TIGR03435 family)
MRIKLALLSSVAFGMLAAAQLSGQLRAGETPGPTYDVVSVRHAPGFRCCFNNRHERPDGGFTLEKGTIAVLVGQAYGLLARDVVGLPEWATGEAYDVVATASRPAATMDDRRAMKQALLADRFQFRAHFETREREGFDLVKAHRDGRLGPGLVPYEVDCIAVALAARAAREAGEPPPPESIGTDCNMAVTRTGLAGAMPVGLLADLLGSVLGQPVVDKTGISGTFRVRLSFDQPATTRADAPPSDTLPSLFSALPEQLGLKLEPARVPVRVLVVDRIERPSSN